jgi:hypothetical protein
VLAFSKLAGDADFVELHRIDPVTQVHAIAPPVRRHKALHFSGLHRATHDATRARVPGV